MAFSLRKALGATSAIGLAISLAACGPDDMAVNGPDHFALGDISGPYSWPMDGYDALNDVPSDAYGDWAPLNSARPMVARRTSGYDYAPAWDYPEAYYYDEPEFASYDSGYYDDGYYDSPYFERAYYGPAGHDWYNRSPDTGSYALLALAAVLGGVIGNSPPDYYFDYGRVQPWVWVTDDHYVRYAEPLRTGYRYYYYAPDAARPFLVRDPLYTYGYSGDRLVVIYDSYGRVLNRDRAVRLRRAATSYYDRGVTLYRTGVTADRYGVSAPLWQQRSATILADQQVWDRAQTWNSRWQDWDKRYEKAADNRWQRERIARTYAAKRFAAWQDNNYRGEAPRPRKELRTKSNPHKAVLQRAAYQARQQDAARSARLERVKAERRSVNGNQARMIAARQERAAVRQGNANQRMQAVRQAQVKSQRQQKAQRQQSQRQQAERQQRAQGQQARREQAQRNQRAQAQRQQQARREQAQRNQRAQAQRQQQARREQAQRNQRAQAQRQQQARREQAQRNQRAQAQRQQQARREQAQRNQRAQAQRQQQARREQAQRNQRAQAQRQQQARREQAQRNQRAQAQRQQQARREEAQRNQRAQAQRQQQARREQAQRNQRAQAQRQQQARREQAQRNQRAQAQRQQQARREQAQRNQRAQAQRQQQSRQTFASNDQRGQNRGNGRNNR